LRQFLKAGEGDRFYSPWHLLPTTGLRPNEALGLKWTDLDLEEGKLRVQRSLSRVIGEEWKLTAPKTKLSRRTIQLSEVRGMERKILAHRTTSVDPYIIEETAWAEMVILFRQDYAEEPVRFSNDLARLAADRRFDNLLVYKLLLGGDLLQGYRRLQTTLVDLGEVLQRNMGETP
jgi:integrase